MLKVIGIFLTVLLISSCTMGPSLGTLKRPTVIKQFIVSEEIRYKQVTGLLKYEEYVGINSGVYTSFLENESGIFYMCPRDCVVAGEFTVEQSGVYVPFDKKVAPLLFNYNGSAKTRDALYQSGNYVYGAATLLDPTIVFFPALSNEDFVNKLNTIINNGSQLP